MADLIRTPSGPTGGTGAIMKDKLGSPSTGSDDGGDVGNECSVDPEPDEVDTRGERVPPAPPESEWYHGRLDRLFDF